MIQANLQPTLEDNLVLIRPLKQDDFEALFQAAKDPLIWEQHTVDRYKRDVFSGFFKDSIESGGALVVIDKETDKVIGSSRYKPVDGVDSAVEIGWSFLTRKYWGGRYNKTIKTMMIDHILNFFTDIIFYVDQNNIRSQKAVEKIGGIRLSPDSEYNRIRRSNSDVTFLINKESWYS